MKKILVLSDIHANYPALKAILKHVKSKKFDHIINAGDLIVYGSFPNETINWFRSRKKIFSIAGNMEERVLRILKGKKLIKPQNKDKRVMYFWTAKKLSSENIDYLRSLHEQMDIIIENVRIGVFHGTFDKADEDLVPLPMENRFSELAKKSDHQIHIMGHSHMPFHKIVNGVHFINPGSAGRMFDGNPQVSFAILNICSKKISVEHFRISYPVKEIVKSLNKNNLPDIYVRMFQTGRKLN